MKIKIKASFTPSEILYEKNLVKTFIYLINVLINFYIYNLIKSKYLAYGCALKLCVWCVSSINMCCTRKKNFSDKTNPGQL